MTMHNHDALRSLLFHLADDEFVLGHRMSEWTGQGPIIEEDIAFSSMAQDELGHALGLYELLASLGEADPDTLVYARPAGAFRNCILTELPRGDYAFSLMRQFLYDAAEQERFGLLRESAWQPLRELAAKILQEERYHWAHGTSFVRRLAGGTGDGRERMQRALDECFPFALGLFEPFDGNDALAAEGIAPLESELARRWLTRVCPLLETYGLRPPARERDGRWDTDVEPVYGGRVGRHSGHFDSIHAALHLLRDADPAAAW